MCKVKSNHLIDEKKEMDERELRSRWEDLMDELSVCHPAPKSNAALFEQMRRDSDTAFEVIKMENAKVWSWDVTD